MDFLPEVVTTLSTCFTRTAIRTHSPTQRHGKVGFVSTTSSCQTSDRKMFSMHMNATINGVPISCSTGGYKCRLV